MGTASAAVGGAQFSIPLLLVILLLILAGLVAVALSARRGRRGEIKGGTASVPPVTKWRRGDHPHGASHLVAHSRGELLRSKNLRRLGEKLLGRAGADGGSSASSEDGAVAETPSAETPSAVEQTDTGSESDRARGGTLSLAGPKLKSVRGTTRQPKVERPAPAAAAARSTRRASATATAKRPWHSYATWTELEADEEALADFFAERTRVLDNPNLDWTLVHREVQPLLRADREWIGLINLDPDGRTLRVVAMEASPTAAAPDAEEGGTFASVPPELVEKFAARPALFIFHTHIDDPRSWPLPSSHDLVAAVYLGALSRYAANVVISPFGAIVYGLDWPAYRALHSAKNWALAALHLALDVSSAHEAIRSWTEFSLQDYADFYSRHKLLWLAYPSPTMVAEGRRRFQLDLESSAETDLISEQQAEIARLRDDKLPRVRLAAKKK